MNIEDYVIIITLVPHGYEIDLVEAKYLSEISRKFKHSECRDYGGNIDVAKVSKKIIELVRNAEEID